MTELLKLDLADMNADELTEFFMLGLVELTGVCVPE